jgi:type VI protein secretion system component Hcp
MSVYVDFGDPIGDYCQALSFSFNVGAVDRLAGGASSKSQVFQVFFTKEADSLSHQLFLMVANGGSIPSVTVEIWPTERACTLMYTMQGVVVVSFQTSAKNSIESVGLHFESISYRYFAE